MLLFMFLGLLFWWKLLIVFSFFVQNILIKNIYIYIINCLGLSGQFCIFFMKDIVNIKSTSVTFIQVIYTSRYLLKHLKKQMLLFMFFRFIVLMKVTHYILFLSIYLSKKLFITSCVNHIFLSVYLSKSLLLCI